MRTEALRNCDSARVCAGSMLRCRVAGLGLIFIVLEALE